MAEPKKAVRYGLKKGNANSIFAAVGDEYGRESRFLCKRAV